MKCILICSDRYRERKNKTIESLHRVGISDIITSDSVFISEYPEDFGERKYIGNKKRKGLGTIGCYLAHVNAIKKSLYFNEHCMICEDDIFLTDIFKKNINDILHYINCNDISLTFMYSKREDKKREYYFKTSPKKFIGAYCYIINNKYKSIVLDEVLEYYGAIDKILHMTSNKIAHLSRKMVLTSSSLSIIDEIN